MQELNNRCKRSAADQDKIEIWPDPIDPAGLLSEIETTIKRFIICSPETAIAATLWIVFTWILDAVNVAPLAVITAPEKRCGKTEMLSLLGRLVANPISASNITASAMFRIIERDRPTLLIDEADTFMKDEGIRGVLNAGHTRNTAYIYRSDSQTFEPRRFEVWGAKAIAGIGHLSETLMDRSIILELRRKLPNEDVDRLRHAEKGLLETLRAKIARFAEDYIESIGEARPNLPDELNDRAQDNWEPLLAIADVAGGEWPEKARKAALKISGTEEPAESTNSELLADIREIFDIKGIDRISTLNLIHELCVDAEKPWSTFNRGKKISPHQVACRLRKFGIASKNIRMQWGRVLKGYELSQFKETFDRYLPQLDATTLQCSNDGDSDVAGNYDVAGNPLRSGTIYSTATCQPAPIQNCSGVTPIMEDCNIPA